MVARIRKSVFAAVLVALWISSNTGASYAASVLMMGGSDLNTSGPNGAIAPIGVPAKPAAAAVEPAVPSAAPAPPFYTQNPIYGARPMTAVRPHYAYHRRTYFQEHPKMRAALIGAGVGAGAGTGLVTGRGVFRGAAIGAGAGAGVGLIRSSVIMRRHPILKDVATGGVAGLGLGMAAGHHMGGRGLGVGAAIGLGVGLLKHLR